MKKIFAFISILAAASAVSFADVTAKKLADGKVEATFFYGNPRATEVLLAGDFTNWQSGALTMEKGDKGFTLTKVFDAGTTVKYKFISDGNWTTDLKAPDFVDDGFGGKNSLAELDSIAGGADAGAVKYPNVKYQTWSMLGLETKFSTQKSDDKSSKETKAESVAFGFKNFSKLGGKLTPNMPFYIELALAEQDYEDAKVQVYSRSNDKDANEELAKSMITNLVSDPLAYLAKTETDKWDTNWKLGHLRFGWECPYVKYTAGYNYAKMPMRQAITWATISDNFDAGYSHNGGFSLIEAGDKLTKFGDTTINYGLNLNKSADRKGTKYGNYAYVSADTGALKLDAQWNAMYGSDYLFYDPVENDVILGAKTNISGVTIALQGLLAIHNKSTKDILGVGNNYVVRQVDGKDKTVGDDWKAADYFGYSTDIFYRNDGVDGIENMAANAQVSWKNDAVSLGAEYRLRGVEASMLYIRNNHDDNDLRLKDMLGKPNSQRVKLNAAFNATEALNIALETTVETQLKKYDTTDDTYVGVNKCWASGYASNDYTPIFVDNGFEFMFNPSVSYTLDDVTGFKSGIRAYAIMNYRTYEKLDTKDAIKYDASDDKFLFKYAGIAFTSEEVSDNIKGLNLYYGLDNSNSKQLYNTLVGQIKLPGDISTELGFGIRSKKNTDAADALKTDEMNPFGFSIGASKKLKGDKAPIVYAQFMWNMDPYKGFGDGPSELNIQNGANLCGRKYDDAVDRYDGSGALRVGMWWNF